eukprot:6223564-Amphidinium_carterae.1
MCTGVAARHTHLRTCPDQTHLDNKFYKLTCQTYMCPERSQTAFLCTFIYYFNNCLKPLMEMC